MKPQKKTAFFLRLPVIAVIAITLNARVLLAQDPPAPQNEDDNPVIEDEFSAPEPEESTSSNKTTWLVIGGAAVIGLGALALGGGGGGGSSDDQALTVETISTETDSSSSDDEDDDDDDDDDSSDDFTDDDSSSTYTGPDLNGGGWNGYVNLVNYGNENVSISATVSQDGRSITISTNSPFSYAKSFRGTISDGGYIKVKDQSTGETWTTHSGSASASHFAIYDYVNDFTDLDKLEVSR